MKNVIKEVVYDEITAQSQNWLMWVFAGLGVSIAINEFLGGMLLSCAAAAIMARTRQDNRKKWLMIVTAIVLAVMTAIVWPSVHTEIPVQFGMALSGFLSRWIVNFMAKFMDRVEERADDVADEVLDRVAKSDKGKDDG